VTAQGVTFDTGMLVALERRRQAAWEIFRRVRERATAITVPAPVIGEWWRGRSDLRDAILSAVHVEPLTDDIARLAGVALSRVRTATAIDAFVMASAARQGNVVYTGDIEDLERLRAFFPGVRVLSIAAR
jgi:predicted nucleic acid-binding protein